ncbi:MAG: anion transporter [bacterium]|nr:MAG: anion transporter [bacterium]
MDLTVLTVFILVYLAMILGRIPGLALDRTGAALLGAIALMAAGRVSPEDAWSAVDTPTMGLLFALMVVSAQFRMSGFYSRVIRSLGALPLSPLRFLGLLVAVVGGLSALLANDIVCLAAAPVLVGICGARGLNPVPFLVALACSANVGSAATLIGNPQNMLIGQVLELSFAGYLGWAAVPAAVGLFLVWVLIAALARGKWHAAAHVVEDSAPAFNAWQTGKGLAVLGILLGLFLFSPWPRDVVALAGAGLLLCSRRMRSREILGLVDWQLLVLFFSLFVLNRALLDSGTMDRMGMALLGSGVDLSNPAWLFGTSAVLSNLVSNVPAVMLLLPSAVHPAAGPVLALSSTLAGNLFIVGSIANIIVVDQAGRMGVGIGWRDHAWYGVPVTLATLAFTAAWLLLAVGA